MIMFNNLNAELSRRGMTQKELASKIGINPSTLSKKMNGIQDFTLPEAKRIKQILSVDISIDELFSVFNSA